MNRRTFWTVVLISVGVASASAAEETGAKAMFYSGEGVTLPSAEGKRTAPARTGVPKKAAKAARGNTHQGISYWVEAIGPEGRPVRTTASHVFHSGDRIRLKFRTNCDGYLYVLNIGSSGRMRVLLPTSDESNYVTAGATYSLPQSSYMVLDNTPGEEHLLVVLAKQPLDMNLKDADTAPRLRMAGAKDILFEEDSGSVSAEPAQYAVVPVKRFDAGGTVSVNIRLKHR